MACLSGKGHGKKSTRKVSCKLPENVICVKCDIKDEDEDGLIVHLIIILGKKVILECKNYDKKCLEILHYGPFQNVYILGHLRIVKF